MKEDSHPVIYMVTTMNVASLKPISQPFAVNAQVIAATKSGNTTKGRKIENPSPGKINNQLFQESHLQSPITSLKSKLIAELPEKIMLAKSTPARDIIIADSGKTFDIASAWEEIDYQLQELIGISPRHLEKTKQYLQNLTVCEFQYFEDLVDQLILQLNAEEGTQYPLTGDLKTDPREADASTSSVQQFFQFMVTVLATQALCKYLLPQAAAAPSGNNTNSPKFTYGSVSSSERGQTNYLSRLPDACLIQPPKSGGMLRDEDVICLPDGDNNNYFYIQSRAAKNVVVSTGHGSGDLSLSVKNGGWPSLTGRPSSSQPGNTECAIIDNPQFLWTYISVSGNKEKATLSVNFDSNKCQVPLAEKTPLRLSTVLPLPDMCRKESAITLRGPLTGLRGNNAICLPDGNQSTYNFYAFALKPPKSIAITSSHGTGDLTLWARGGRWPSLDEKPVGSVSDNNQCFIIENNDQVVTYITVQGSWEKASMAVDFDKDTCRVALRPGFTQATEDRTDGYPYTGAVLLVYKLNFPDAKLNWPTLEDNLTAAKEYFKDQSYDNFAVSWQTVEVDILESVDNFTGSQNRDKWQERCREIVEGTGVSWPDPGTDKIIMLASPNVADLSHVRDNAVIYARDNTHDVGAIAYGMGSAMGLRPAYALEAGSEIIKNLPEDDSWFNCNGQTSCIDARDQYLHQTHNILSVMGSGAGPMNLLHKSFFGWLDLDNDVPMVNASGLYRIHTFDRGDKSNGPVGLRIQSGNGDYTYWLEYRTTGRWSDNTQQGVLINLEGYAAGETNNDNPRYWKTRSYLLDMTPGSKNSTNWRGEDLTDAALTVGQSYTDHWGGFTLTPRRVGGTANSADAWIEVAVAKTPDEKIAQPPTNSTGFD